MLGCTIESFAVYIKNIINKNQNKGKIVISPLFLKHFFLLSKRMPRRLESSYSRTAQSEVDDVSKQYNFTKKKMF